VSHFSLAKGVDIKVIFLLKFSSGHLRGINGILPQQPLQQLLVLSLQKRY
jgi:hypothetical protein